MQFQSALIVDDHPLFCDALSMTLRSIPGMQDVFTAASLSDALSILKDGIRIDVVVLDLNLPDVDGLDGLARVLAATNAPIVVVSSMAEDRLIGLAVKSGASGYVPKHSQREVFHTALSEIAKGAVFYPEDYVPTEDGEDDMAHDDAVSRLSSLTNQQMRILLLICEGKLNKQIAFDLSIAETTVKAHITAIMRKLGVQSRTQAALLVKATSFSNVLHEEYRAT